MPDLQNRRWHFIKYIMSLLRVSGDVADAAQFENKSRAELMSYLEPVTPDEVLRFVVHSVVSFREAPALSDQRRLSSDALEFAHELLRDTCVFEILPRRCQELLADINSPTFSSSLQQVAHQFRDLSLTPLHHFIANVISRSAHDNDFHKLCMDALKFVCRRAKNLDDLISSRRKAAEAGFSAPYNPVVNLHAYYFTPHGNKVRDTHDYIGLGASKDADDKATACCKTSMPSSGHSTLFFVFCLPHSHCLG